MVRAPVSNDFAVDGRSYVRLGTVQGWLCIGLAAAVLGFGWLGSLDWLTGRFRDGWPQTTPWSATLFIALAGAALLGRRFPRVGTWTFGAVLSFAAALTILTFAGVDRPWTPLRREVVNAGGPAPGLPSLAALTVIAMIALSGILLLERRAPMTRTMLATIATLVAMSNGIVTAIRIEPSGSAYGFSVITALLSMFAVAAVCAMDENVAPAAMYRMRPWQTMGRVTIGALICIPLIAYIQSNSSQVPPDMGPVTGALVLLAVTACGVCWFGWVDFEAQGWKRLAEHSTDAVLAVDSNGRIRHATGQCKSVTGWTASQLKGKTVGDLIDPELRIGHESLMKAFPHSPTAQAMGSRPVQLLAADGSQRLVAIKLVPVIGPDGPLVYATLNDASRESALRHQATHDQLTAILNRAGITDYLERELSRGNTAGVLFLDVDNLKVINDELSHAAGDAALRAVAGAVETKLRGRDRVGRLGGDEFACVITDLDSQDVLTMVANRIADSVGEIRITGPDGPTSVSVSMGGVLASKELGAQAALDAADKAMYEVKNAGGNKLNIADDAGGDNLDIADDAVSEPDATRAGAT